MVNLFYGLPEDVQRKINWMNIHDEMKTLVSQRQSEVVFLDGTTNTSYVHDVSEEWPTWLELEYFLDWVEHIKLQDPLKYEKYVDEKSYWEPQWA